MDKVEKVVRHIANNPIGLKDLTVSKLSTIGRQVIYDELKHEMSKKVGLYRIKYEEERDKYLSRFGYYTRVAYQKGIHEMETYCCRMGIKNPLYLSAHEADSFVIDVSRNKAPNTARMLVAGCSSMFTWLQRQYDVIKNPLRGCRERPQKKNVNVLALPTEDEINKVIKYTKGELSVAIQILKECGVRVGILPGLTIRDNRYSGWSKGKFVTGDMPKEIIDRMKKMHMNLNCPFKKWDDKKIKNNIQYKITRLCNKGIIQTRFSPHDLRHVKAINEYKKSHDIIKVRDLLNHSSISMTEIYMKGLGVI